jgi:hypothetical protein
VNILPQGGSAFFLYSLGVNMYVNMSGIHADVKSYCEDTRNMESFCERNCFPRSPRHICMNRDFPLLPIRSTLGKFKSGHVIGRGTAAMAVCED